MPKKVKFVIVGAGNISNTRHIPALKKIKNAEIVGVISNKIERAQRTAEKHNIPNAAKIEESTKGLRLAESSWMEEADAWVIGAPPHLHYPLVKLGLELDKHVLVEKPMMMNEKECDELIALAKSKGKLFYVMHNFQYANKMLKLNDIIESKKHGDVVSITEVQFTNHDRRLPEWYNDLPLGLFYDEAAHFLYLPERHVGSLKVEQAYATYDTNKKEATPITLSVNATAGDVPLTMFLNFRSPVCEWYYMVSFKRDIYIYDFFKDILIHLPTDGEHLGKDVLRSSVKYTGQYWRQFIANGFRMVTGNLLYGHDKVLGSFTNAINGGDVDKFLTAENGRINVAAAAAIVNKVNKR